MKLTTFERTCVALLMIEGAGATRIAKAFRISREMTYNIVRSFREMHAYRALSAAFARSWAQISENEEDPASLVEHLDFLVEKAKQIEKRYDLGVESEAANAELRRREY